jgi:DNA-binding LacI/PurR family transcriptional regulator
MTIKDVATRACVSTATVSRVINNSGFVQANTKKKVLSTIEEMGYKPTARQKIRSSWAVPLKYRNIALIWTGDSSAAFTETGREMMKGILSKSQALGANLIVDYITDADHIPNCLLKEKIDGLLLHGPEPSPIICETLRQYPCVWMLQSGSVEFGDHVQPDHNFIGRIAAKHLVNKGCKELCCISYAHEFVDPPYWQSRANGFVNCAKALKINYSILNCSEKLKNAAPEAQAKQLIDSLAKLKPHPDGLFITNDLGNLIHGELMSRGITPMKEILTIAGNTSAYPKVININFFSKKIGQLAVDALLWRIKNPTYPIVTHSIKSELIIP